MFWTRKEAKLQISEPRQKIWNHQIVKESFASTDNQDIVDYAGWAYVLEGEHQGGFLSGQAACNTLQRALFNLDIAVSESARVTVSCNGERVWAGMLDVAAGSSNSTLHHLSVDITQMKEARPVSDIKVEFVFVDRLGTIWVLADENADRLPKIQQIPSWSHAAWSILFFVAAWGGLIGLLFIAISLSGIINDPRFSALISVLGLLLTYFGLRDIAKIPLREAMRRLYAWTRETGQVFTGSIILLLSFIILLAIVTLDVSWKRYEYADLINDYYDLGRDPRKLRDAIISEPWRREAQILFEQTAIKKRTSRAAFRDHVRIITDDEMVQAAIQGAGSVPPLYLGNNRRAISDPVRWFASMLPEGDDEGETVRTEQAIELLGKRDTPEARLQRLVLSIEQPGQTRERVVVLIEQIQELYSQCDFADYSVQLALDMLGNFSIIDDLDQAAEYFNALLTVRSDQKTEVRHYWRAPDKLVLFQLFRSYFDRHDIGADPIDEVALPILDYKPEGSDVGFRSVFETKIYSKDANKKFQDEDGWIEGTIVDLDQEWISDTLKIGWRF